MVVAWLVSRDSCDPGTVAHQAPLPIGFPRQEYWSGLLFHPPGDLPDPGIEPMSSALQLVSCIAGRFSTTEPPGKPQVRVQTENWLGLSGK